MFANHIENNQPLAVCLHASASSSQQWNKLRHELEGSIRTVAPDMVGYGKGLRYRKGSRFHFDQELDNILLQVQRETGKQNGPLHVIGHSYGGATALQLAMRHPNRVASLTLYEPVQFLLLFANGLESAAAREIVDVRNYAVSCGSTPWGLMKAARRFIEYWSGEGIWDHLDWKRRLYFARKMPKVLAEFDAILSAGVTAEDFAKLNIPVRLICGTNTRRSARRVAEILAATLPNVEYIEVEGAAHMAPVTQAKLINPLIVENVLGAMEERVDVAA